MPNPIRRREFLGGLAATGLAADLLAAIASMVDGLDVASAGELARALLGSEIKPRHATRAGFRARAEELVRRLAAAEGILDARAIDFE